MKPLDPHATAQFVQLATRQMLLSSEQSAELTTIAEHDPSRVADVAIAKGWMSANDVEVVHTLLRPGDSIPGYEILGLLGRGGMGVVYRARQLNLNREVALKTISLEHSARAGSIARFEQEARSIARLQHPQIVTAYDFGRQEGRVYLALELVEGDDLETYLQTNGRLPEALAWGLVRQAAAGLAAAERLGIVHRDIKPANLLLVQPPAGYPLPPGMPLVKITDFGLAFLASGVDSGARLTVDGTALGSPHYMAPEQLAGKSVDSRADIYALGATCYHLLSGHAPFPGETVGEVLTNKIKHDTPPLRDLAPGLSPASIALVERMMAELPEHRPAGCDALLTEIDALLAAFPPFEAAAGQTWIPRRPSPEADSAAVTVAAPTAQSLPTAAALPTSAAPSIVSPRVPLPPAAAAPLDSAPRRTLARWLLRPTVLLFGAMLLAVLAWGLWQGWGKPRSQVRQQWVATGWSAALFDGQSLSGWSIAGGQWRAGLDVEGGRALVGTGTIRRLLPPPGPARADAWALYRLSVNYDMHRASAVELQGGFDPVSQDSVVLRATRNEIQFGQRRPFAAELNVFGAIEPPSVAANAPPYRELRLERHEHEWTAFVNGEFIGSIPHRGAAERPEVRLRAEGGEAIFDDPMAVELKPGSAVPAVE